MTQAELDALPVDGGFGIEEEEIDGKIRRRCVMLPTVGVLWTEHDEPRMVMDARGIRWRVGRGPDGVMYKQHMSQLVWGLCS